MNDSDLYLSSESKIWYVMYEGNARRGTVGDKLGDKTYEEVLAWAKIETPELTHLVRIEK